MSDVVILVPRRRDRGPRDRLWNFARAAWSEHFPEWPIVEGHHEAEEGPYNRSKAVNRAADLAGEWRVAVVIDSDVLPNPDAILDAVRVARGGRPASGFSVRNNLSRAGTERILGGFRGSWEKLIANRHPLCISGAFAVSRDLFEKVGGFDENFVGWGFEDTAFEIATETISGESLHRVDAVLWHLWHPKSPEHDSKLPNFTANRARRERYTAASGDPAALEKLLEEARAVREGTRARGEAISSRETRIPRILHRTVPEETSEEVEGWWSKCAEVLPGWELRTYREPLDPAGWETGDLWHLCSSGAQRAGLIRLEALFRFGGVYFDSDVEPYRNLEPLLELRAFAGWEDARCVPDAVLGSEPAHPAFAIMLEKARAAILAGSGAWDSGPGVTTSTLPGRADVLLLPPGSFYPYHYKRKEELREVDHRTEQPWSFAAHHWHHSWEGR